MEDRFIWFVVLHCVMLGGFFEFGDSSFFEGDLESHFVSALGDSKVTDERTVYDLEASGFLALERDRGSAAEPELGSGDTIPRVEQSAQSSLTPLPPTISIPPSTKGTKKIRELTVRFESPTTFIVRWQQTSRSSYKVTISQRDDDQTLLEEIGTFRWGLRLNTTSVPLESFKEYMVTVFERETGVEATIPFWSPPEPPSAPALQVMPQPGKLVITWDTPTKSNRALLDFRLRICVELGHEKCKNVTVGSGIHALTVRTTPVVETYTVELWASHRFVFGDFSVDSDSRNVTRTSCRGDTLSDLSLHFNRITQKAEFLFSKRHFSHICGFGIVDKLEIEWSDPRAAFTCASPLEHSEWIPSSEEDPFTCNLADWETFRCSIGIRESQPHEFGDRRLVVKAVDAEGRCAFAVSNTALIVARARGEASALPWVIFGVLVAMTTLGIAYKKREPLWTFATDLISNFSRRSRCHNGVELPRVSYFKIRSPEEAARFTEEYFQKKRDMNYAMSLEYEQIQQDSERLMADQSFGLQPELRLKNRYKNIIPFNNNRVVLQAQNGEVLSTYINASLVKGFDGRAKCIVSQGPKMESLEDFLRMLIEYDVSLIASLLSTIDIDVDQDKRQCSRYWPREVGASEEFGKFSVKLESESRYDCFLRRNLKISGPGVTHRVAQLHFFRWPDHQTPTKSEDLLTFLSVYRTLKRGTPVIHCSAGVGRSGTLVALDFLMDLLEKGERPTISRVVAHLRTQRVSMIQTEEQYVFLYDCIYAAVNEKSQTKYLNNYMTHAL
ncbi:uncharacterized protein LOC100901647 [Galendromus occidentalis]|uniref:Uncharacterized protein LOC100901647 n=1 Tax=Galendromus occidentalis TaxID=34638 RepID=A0AAJ6QWC3_9ACAR|nr:uncharacterized protein LOC100901647 [Galendromus occidentalis]